MKKTGILIATTMVVLLAGCQTSVPEQKAIAYKRWYNTQAKILYGIASENLKTGQLDSASQKAQEALSLDSQYLDARVLLGKVYIEQGHYALAVQELRQCAEKLPDSAEIQYLLGVAQEKDGKLDDALESYRRSHVLDPRGVDAIVAAGETLVELGRMEEAQTYVESYLATAGTEPAIYELAARVASMNKDYKQGVCYAQQAVDMDGNNLRYREMLARLQFQAGLYNDVSETLRELLQQKNYTASVWTYTLLGDCYMAMNRPELAKDQYYSAADRSPEDPGVWTNLSKAALAMGDLPRAILSANRALNLDADNLDASLLAGCALLRQGEPSRAMSLLNKAVTTHPNSALAYCLLGCAMSAGGNEIRAAEYYAMALRLEPENRLAKELLLASSTKKPS
jgi:tetratricopeptide (TPR) repeat protein